MIIEIFKQFSPKIIERSIMLKFTLKTKIHLTPMLTHPLIFNRLINLSPSNLHLLSLLPKTQGFMKRLKLKQEEKMCQLRDSCRNI